MAVSDGLTPTDTPTVRALALWLAGGALALGALGYVVGHVTDPAISPEIGAAVGLATGGGLGALVRLLVVDEAAGESTETVTFETGEQATESPTPADLFDGLPDPALYVGGDPPVVRAANPAFAETFGRDTDAVAGKPLVDALPHTGAEDLQAAFEAGDPVAMVQSCDTVDGTATYRIRVVVGAGRGGYLIYTQETPE